MMFPGTVQRETNCLVGIELESTNTGWQTIHESCRPWPDSIPIANQVYAVGRPKRSGEGTSRDRSTSKYRFLPTLVYAFWEQPTSSCSATTSPTSWRHMDQLSKSGPPATKAHCHPRPNSCHHPRNTMLDPVTIHHPPIPHIPDRSPRASSPSVNLHPATPPGGFLLLHRVSLHTAVSNNFPDSSDANPRDTMI